MESDSAELVQRAAEGDREALDALWRCHHAWIAAVIVAHLGDGPRLGRARQTDIDDVLQEVAIAVVRNINTLSDQTKLRPWLRAIAVNTVRTAARRRSAGPITLNGHGGHELHEAVSAAPETFSTGAIMDHLLALPLIYREPLLLKGVRGLNTRHIAVALDLPVKTVETRVIRGRRLLIDAMSQQDAPLRDADDVEVIHE